MNALPAYRPKSKRAKQDESCQRLMSAPGIGPIVSSAVVAAIGNGSGFKQGRDFACSCRPHTLSSSDGQGQQDKVCGRGSRRHRSGFPATCWQLRSPTSSLASPGQFSTKGARSNARRPMRWHPKLLNPRAVLTPIKAWPGNLEQAASQVRRPALTATARGASQLATSIATVMQTRSRKVATHASNCTLGQPTFGIG